MSTLAQFSLLERLQENSLRSYHKNEAKWNECSNPEMSNSRLVKMKIWCSRSQGHVRLSGRGGQPGVAEMLLKLKEKVNTRACLSSIQYPVSRPFSEPSQKLLMDSFLNCCYIRIGLNLAAEINTAITIPKDWSYASESLKIAILVLARLHILTLRLVWGRICLQTQMGSKI